MKKLDKFAKKADTDRGAKRLRTVSRRLGRIRRVYVNDPDVGEIFDSSW